MAYIRKFKTTSGATGVQVCYKEGNRVVKTVHIGSASSEKALRKLMLEAQKTIDAEKGTPMFNLQRFETKWFCLYVGFGTGSELVDFKTPRRA